MLAVLNRSVFIALDELRGKVFMEKVDGNHVIKPESPTDNRCYGFTSLSCLSSTSNMDG